jgi:hypothetical protein
MRLRAIVPIAGAALAAMFVAPAAQAVQPAAESAPCYPAHSGASLAVSTTRPMMGEQITLSGANFKPDTSLRLVLHTQPVVLTSLTVGGQGSFTTQVRLPDGVTGAHRIVAVGTPENPTCPGSPVVTIRIQSHGAAGSSAGPGPGGPGGTSFTGVDVLLIVIAALVLLGVGVVLNKTGGKRKEGSGHPLIDG